MKNVSTSTNKPDALDHTLPRARRRFLKNFIFGTAFSSFVGRDWIGTVVADCQPADPSAGILKVLISSFPALRNVNGSVRLALNPFNASSSFVTPFYPVLVNRGPDNQFFGLSARCTHEGCVASPGNGSCPCHGSRYRIDGSVLVGPAFEPLEAYPTTFDGDNTVCIEIPGLAFNITAEAVQAVTGPRVRLQFPTIRSVRYEVRRRDSVSSAGIVVPFSTTQDGAATTMVFTGNDAEATVFVDRTGEGGILSVAIQARQQ